MNLKRQLFSLYVSSFFSGLRITDAVWVALLAARGFPLWQIGLAEGIFHAVSLVCEVPSGMAADLLGRKKTLLLGSVFVVTCNLLMAFAPSIGFVSLAMVLNALANTMFSGTDAALAYDSLKQCGREEEYLSISADRSQLQMLAGAVGSLASTLHRWLHFTGFYLLSAGFETTSGLVSLLLTEPVVTEAQAGRERQSLRTLPARFVQLMRDSASALHASPAAVRIIAADAFISIPSYLTKMFLQQRLVELGWNTALLFVPLLCSGLAAVLGTELGHRVCPHSLRQLYAVCAPVCGLGAVLVGCSPAPGAIAGSMLVQGSLSVWLLHAEQQLNDAIPSDQRATLISVDSMAYSLLMIPASPLVGAVGDALGQAGAGLTVLGILVAASALRAVSRRM